MKKALLCIAIVAGLSSAGAADNTDWPGFRGPGGRGVAAGFETPEKWDATDPKSSEVQWRVAVPGSGHSSPVVYGDRVYLTTAVSTHKPAKLRTSAGGAPTAADDNGEQTWLVLCYHKHTGKELWRREARKGKPKATRHIKATHANTSVAVDDKHIVAFFGSEGCYCYDHSGELLWNRDLGVIDISKYGIGWGYASSPTIHSDRVVLVCDDPKRPFLVALRLSDGEELWRTSRKDDCQRSWSTALIHQNEKSTQVVVNGWPWIVSYDLATGKERWRIDGGGDNPVPTPFAINDRIYITSSHGGKSPIYAINSAAKGNLSKSVKPGSVVWKTVKGGSYMSTPVIWGEYLYLGNTNGVVRCFHALTGKKMYEERLGRGAAITASLVAADNKIYCSSEDGIIYVLPASPEFKILAKNKMGSPCLATPAISAGVLFVRTTTHLVAIKKTD